MEDLNQLNAAFFQGRKFCATGRMLCFTRRELGALVESQGGKFLTAPARTGFCLIVGEGGWPETKGGDGSQVWDRARQLKALGYEIEFLAEDEFLEQIGLRESARSIRGPHTLGDLARILEISPVRIRRWMKLGLIEPTSSQHHIHYFDYRQVALIKRLQELVDDGASLQAIRRGIQATRDSLPHSDSLESIFTAIESDGSVLMRMGGSLVDQSGQKRFDFDAADDGESTVFADAVQTGFHDLCDEALLLEDEGKFEEAADAYRRAIELQPDHPTLHFDLGNVLFELGRLPESIECFETATRLDAEMATAWHNLGVVRAQTGDWAAAERALRQALRYAPTYADSHYTLAEVLKRVGRQSEARKHEALYERHSSPAQIEGIRETFLRVFAAEDEERLTS